MIDTASESLIALNQVPKYLEELTGKKRPHIASIYRWLKNGIAGVRLETLNVGGTRFTSEQALHRFFQATTQAKEKKKSQPSKAVAATRKQAIEAQAVKLGI